MPITLMQHQANGASALGANPRYALWWDCGTGKTITVLAQLDAAKRAAGVAASVADLDPKAVPVSASLLTTDGNVRATVGPHLKTVVVCPKAIMHNAWERDAEHFPELAVKVLWANGKDKREALAHASKDADVFVINPENFKDMRGILYRDLNVRRMVVDESSMLKSKDTQISKACVDFGDYMESVWLLSGTPAPNCPTEYWSQYRVMDAGVFGKQFFKFASIFFSPQQRNIGAKKVTVGYKPIPQRTDDFERRLKSRSWSLAKQEAIQLPEQLDVRRDFSLDRAERKAYDQVQDELCATFDGQTIDVRAEAAVAKLRQLTGGWMYDNGAAAEFGKTKLDVLGDTLDEIGRAQALVWADYTHDMDRIAALLDKRGETFRVLDGRFKGDLREVVTAFQAGEIHRLVCHPQSVGHGVTLTAASYAVFFTLPWSWEYYKQARDRIHRNGQKNACTYFHLIARESIDEGVLWSVRRKGTRSEAILRALGKTVESKEAA